MTDGDKTPKLTHNFVSTPDGAQLSYYTIGTGPGLLVLHGAVNYALLFEELALALSPYFTVHLASRRGRGLSGGYPTSVTSLEALSQTSGDEKDATDNDKLTIGNTSYQRTYNPSFTSAVLATEVSDLETLLAATGAPYLFAISSGALITLQLLLSPARKLSALKKVIIFEPPILFADRPTSMRIADLPRFERDMAQPDNVPAAGVTAMRLVELGPTWIPRRLMAWLSGMMFRAQDKAEAQRAQRGDDSRGNCTMAGLIGLLRYDFAVAEGTVAPAARYAALDGGPVGIMLLSGAKSPLFLKEGMAVLGSVLPSAAGVVIDGVGHELPCNAEMRGRPALAVESVRKFFV
jgi:pimeloyl-ACP methyl ester carboxylesterase